MQKIKEKMKKLNKKWKIIGKCKYEKKMKNKNVYLKIKRIITFRMNKDHKTANPKRNPLVILSVPGPQIVRNLLKSHYLQVKSMFAWIGS